MPTVQSDIAKALLRLHAEVRRTLAGSNIDRDRVLGKNRKGDRQRRFDVAAQSWKLGNGASALAAADRVGSAPFLLTMSDHLIGPSLIAKILRACP